MPKAILTSKAVRETEEAVFEFERPRVSIVFSKKYIAMPALQREFVEYAYTRVYVYQRIKFIREDWMKRHTLPRVYVYQRIKFVRED